MPTMNSSWPGTSKLRLAGSRVSATWRNVSTMASDADERVEEEDAAPPDVLGEHAAERGTDREADRGDAGPDPDGASPSRRDRGTRRPTSASDATFDDRRADALEAAR